MKTLSVLILMITACIISSCKKEPFEPPRGQYTSLEDFFAERAPSKQIWSINASSDATITGAKGTKIYFQSNMFVHQDGSPVNGMIQIELIEILTIADMIYSGVYPLSNGELLNSGGEVYIAATQDGEQLKIAEGARYTISLPAMHDDAQIGFYSGKETDTGVNWVMVAPGADTTIDSTGWDTIGYYDIFEFDELDNVYTLFTDSMGWINCDDYPELPRIECTFQVEGHDSIEYTSTEGFFVYDDYVGVYPMYYPDTSNTFYEYDLPQAEGHAIVISIVMGYLHFGIVPVFPEDGGEYTVPIEMGTAEELEAALLAL